MPATPAYIPPAFQPESYRYPWQTELVTPQRTAYGVQDNADFFNSPNSRTVFSYDRDIIQEDWQRDIERRLESLSSQLRRRVDLQTSAFQNVTLETISVSTFPFALLFLATNAGIVSVDATPDASVFFTADYLQRGRVYAEIFFAGEQAEPLEVVVNIYSADNRCVLAHAGRLQETLDQTFQFIRTNFGA